ncbi:MAG: DEAD/DEAH box helicase, partial [Solirubrobacteraceae bacterium]
MSSPSFADLGVSRPAVQALASRGVTNPFPVQRLVVPDVLAGCDVLVKSPTGSGKTLAFGLPLVDLVADAKRRPAALVLAPTRELAAQIVDELRGPAHARACSITAVYGGTGLARQSRLAGRAHALVATPGRLEDLIERGAVSLAHVQLLVLDEADRMLDMGFEADIRAILANAPDSRQTLLFSATFPDAIRALSRGFQRDPVEVTVQSTVAADALEQWFHEVPAAHRFEALATLLAREDAAAAVVFCNTRKDVQEVADALWKRGFAALALHGDLEQRERDEVLVRFANG